MYKRGIKVNERSTSQPMAAGTRYGVQVAVGTAPVHLAQDPYSITNVPVKTASYEDAVLRLGYSGDWEKYTLCQSIQASHSLFRTSPVVFINVLDPKKHKKTNAEKAYPVINHQVKLEEAGVLKDEITVDGFEYGKDYVATFDGEVPVITLLSNGSAYQETELRVTSVSVDPEQVTEADIIGAYDSVTGKETGLELLRQIYPRFQLPPGILLAPGWSHRPNIAAALQGKCEDINGVFKCECLLDLDTEQTKLYTSCANAKAESGFTSEHAIVLWPMLTLDGKIYSYSAVYGAMASALTANNDDIPHLYPSNKLLNIDGAALKDGTEVMLDQVQAAILNGDGIVTAVNDNGWKATGNNTAAYPGNTDPKDRWIACRRMFSFVGNYFAINFKNRIDENMNQRTLDDIVNSFNIWGNSLVSRGICAGLSISHSVSANTLESLIEGQLYLEVKFAPYTPAEYIEATLEFDLSALRNALATADDE